jgi:hypothetical protein
MRRRRVTAVVVVVASTAFGIGARAQSPNAILAYSTAELLEAQRSALLRVAPEPRVDNAGLGRITVCVSINRGGEEFSADSATIATLDLPGRRAVIPRDCPQTYTMAMYSTDRAPPGYIDPYYMNVTHISAPSDTTLVMLVDVTQDIRRKSYRCTVTRNAASWRSECELYSTSAGQ